jgi:hypothetical protein
MSDTGEKMGVQSKGTSAIHRGILFIDFKNSYDSVKAEVLYNNLIQFP